MQYARLTTLCAAVLLPVVLAQNNENPDYYNEGENAQTPDEAGASGKDTGAFSLSKGGLAAIITIAAIVVVLGTASLVLWYLAKKRSWDVRQSIRRASRRFTGRMDDSKSKRQSRRTGVRMQSPPRPKNRGQERDLEKGSPSTENTKPVAATKPNSNDSRSNAAPKTWALKPAPPGNR